MASAITHFITGAALALPAMNARSIIRVMPAWVAPISAGMLAVAPDLDTFAMQAWNIPYDSFWGHRGFIHSPFFLSLFCGALAAVAARAKGWQSVVSLWALWAACAITHPLLDMLTDGGGGVMALYPISDDRLFFPWRPIHVSPMSIARFWGRAGKDS